MRSLHPVMLQNVWAAHQWEGFGRPCYRWATDEPEHQHEEMDGETAVSTVVWANTLSVAETVHGLRNGSVSIDVVELGEFPHRGRFDDRFVPLFWVNKGQAEIVADPRLEEPRGDHAVVLRRSIPHLSDLIAHVEIVDAPSPSFEQVVRSLLASATRIHPDLPDKELLEGIMDRRRTMPTAVGHGVSIPHAFWDGVDESCCFVASVPSGVASMVSPDGGKVHLVFLLLSPLGEAKRHLEALATLARLAGAQEYVDLLARQTVPDRLARLIMERA
ncbi:MAG: PTS sugar transporter subunit IIA [Polyangiaceae bacterium]